MAESGAESEATQALAGRRVVLGVGGGIAAFKSVEMARLFMAQGAEVRVVLTPSAARFAAPLTFAALTGHPVVTDLWDSSKGGEIHVELTTWADAIVVAPATANLMSRAAAGLADDALLCTLLCAKSPALFAPAMHPRMWSHPATQRAVARLREDGARFIGPVVGPLANGEIGMGRMVEPIEIAAAIANDAATGDLVGLRLVVTAGPTVEDLDPVRFLSNRSSGRMGLALVRRALDRGANVSLVHGPLDPRLSIPRRAGFEAVAVRSAREMATAVFDRVEQADAVIMAAAVADYRPARAETEKIKKTGQALQLELVPNPDILRELGQRRRGGRPILVGFALESSDVIGNAQKKLAAKGCDLVVANHVAVAIGGLENEATLVCGAGADRLPRLTKAALADRILDRLRLLWMPLDSPGAL